MDTEKCAETYPSKTIILSNLLSLCVYGLGIFIISQWGWMFALAYLLFALILEYRLIRYHCPNCYYWGKNCGFGKGRISALLFQKGDASKFGCKVMHWYHLIPDMLIMLIPLVIAIVLLITRFDWVLLMALIALIFFATSGNGYIRGKLTCPFCKQRELGCPAEALFDTNRKRNR